MHIGLNGSNHKGEGREGTRSMEHIGKNKIVGGWVSWGLPGKMNEVP